MTENITLSDAMTGVFTEPGETFNSVGNSTRRNYWVLPVIVFAVVSVVSTFLVFNDEELYSEIKTRQTTVMQERLDKAVKEGKMTEEQKNEIIENADKRFNKSSSTFYIFTSAGPVAMVFVSLFFRGLVFWGALKLLKGAADYILVICVLGLSSVIDSLQSTVDTVLAIFLGKLNANIGPALFFSVESINSTMMKFISHFDVFNIWYLIILGIGFAKVSGLKNVQTLPLVFFLWLVWVIATTFLALPFFR